jgi:NADP-reducing hydrogenase subunit HndB
MGTLTLNDLRELRKSQKAQIQSREIENKEIQVLVGMGTCGIAAGARVVFNAFVEELAKQGLSNVLVKQTGCMGLCYSEPTVEIRMPNMPNIIYGKIDEKLVPKVVKDHLMNKTLLSDHIFDKPAVDIVK